MALGSWTGIYIRVIDELMAERRDQELLLLLAIQKHADRLGFCYPGRALLKKLRRAGDRKHDERLAFLVERGHIKMLESYDWRRRQKKVDYQVSPRTLYVRPEFQAYCEGVFDDVEERNFQLEDWLLQNFFASKDSQPETEPDAVKPDAVKPEPETRRRNQTHNQRGDALTQQGRQSSTMRNGDQRDSATQPPAGNATAHRKDNPQAGGPDEFEALLSGDVDDDRIIQEIKHVVSTTEHQARGLVQTYPREGLVHYLRIVAQRRARGELSKPGAWFYHMVTTQLRRIEEIAPNGQTYQDWENDQNSEPQEF